MSRYPLFPEVPDIQAIARHFSLLYSILTSSGAHPASYLMGNGGTFAEGEAAGARNSPLTSN